MLSFINRPPANFTILALISVLHFLKILCIDMNYYLILSCRYLIINTPFLTPSFLALTFLLILKLNLLYNLIAGMLFLETMRLINFVFG